MRTPQNFINEMSTLVQVIDRCRQATRHYLSQCWLRWMSPYDVTRSQWVNKWQPFYQFHVLNTSKHEKHGRHLAGDIFKCISCSWKRSIVFGFDLKSDMSRDIGFAGVASSRTSEIKHFLSRIIIVKIHDRYMYLLENYSFLDSGSFIKINLHVNKSIIPDWATDLTEPISCFVGA